MGLFKRMRYRVRVWRKLPSEGLEEMLYRTNLHWKVMRRLEKKGKIRRHGGPLLETEDGEGGEG